MHTDEHILAYCLGELEPAAREALERQAAGDPALQRRLQRARAMVEQLRQVRSIEDEFALPAASRAKLLGIPNQPTLAQRLAEQAGQLVRTIVATLVSDTGAGTPAAGFRGGSDDRHLRFESADRSVSIRIETLGPARCMLIGRYHGPDIPLEVVGQREGHRVHAPIDAMGFFEMPVGVGRWSLRLALVDAELELPPITVAD